MSDPLDRYYETIDRIWEGSSEDKQLVREAYAFAEDAYNYLSLQHPTHSNHNYFYHSKRVVRLVKASSQYRYFGIKTSIIDAATYCHRVFLLVAPLNNKFNGDRMEYVLNREVVRIVAQVTFITKCYADKKTLRAKKEDIKHCDDVAKLIILADIVETILSLKNKKHPHMPIFEECTLLLLEVLEGVDDSYCEIIKLFFERNSF